MSDQATIKRPAHRPAMAEDQLSKIFDSLIELEKGSPEFRRKRRELATDLDRTERSIEIVFEQLKARKATNEKTPVDAPASAGGL